MAAQTQVAAALIKKALLCSVGRVSSEKGPFFVSDETFRQQAQLNLASEVRERG